MAIASDQLDSVAARLIQNVAFFKGMKPAEVLDFLAKAKQTVIKNGQVVFNQGDEDDRKNASHHSCVSLRSLKYS